ncbi:MAG TPA: PDZ domain-containing protein, partial [Anaerolineales bacterium]|nr:PDZ domain-containing protein [Anaerolineales bacterium]
MTQTLTFTKHIKAPIGHVYHAFATKSGWLDWYGYKAGGKVAKNRVLQITAADSEDFLFHFLALEKDRSITFNILELDNYQKAEAHIALSGTDGDVTVSITLTTDAEKLLHTLSEIWEKSLVNLQSIIETGQDPTFMDRPFMGVTVQGWHTPELAKEKDLPVEYGMQLNSVLDDGGAKQAGIDHKDIITALDGTEIHNMENLQAVYDQHQPGDTISVDFYHGSELKQSRLILGRYPTPKIPANAQDLADTMNGYFEKANTKINRLLEGQSEAQFDYSPDGGEWNAKQIMAHLIADFTDTTAWLGSYINGQPVAAHTSTHPARIKTILSLYPTMPELLDTFKKNQKELVAYLEAIPAEVSSRKSSLATLAFTMQSEFNHHYVNHFNQLKETLA